MSKAKTKIDQAIVIDFLRNNFNQEISEVNFIKGGESSQAFSFSVLDQHYVVRVNSQLLPFEKDKYCFDNFNSKLIPVPEIFQLGFLEEGYYYAISKKAMGVMVQDLSDTEYSNLLPSLLKILDAIHTTDISNTSGFGKWEANGEYESESWKEYMLNVNEHVLPRKNKPSLFETTFLEKDLWDKIYKEMESMLVYCPEDRYLIHGDYGGDNVMAKDGIVTGVLDWAGAKYGDFLYDIAWLNFWRPERNPIDYFVNHYKGTDTMKNFYERIKCYQLRIGLSALSFYAYSDQKDKYESAKQKILKIYNK